jgi:two-component system, OmpR family, sensor histidine kinase KdpD
VVIAESARLERLVRNLLDLSRLQAGGAEPRADWCSIEEVVQAAVDSVPAGLGTFDIELDPDLPLLRADAAQLERALANVMENAARFTGTHPVTIRGRLVGQDLLLRIKDHGPGVRPEDLERIFEPFYRTGNNHDGSGLGLAIARGFVEVNDGRIRAESAPGQGTCFVVGFRAPVNSLVEEPAER